MEEGEWTQLENMTEWEDLVCNVWEKMIDAVSVELDDKDLKRRIFDLINNSDFIEDQGWSNFEELIFSLIDDTGFIDYFISKLDFFLQHDTLSDLLEILGELRDRRTFFSLLKMRDEDLEEEVRSKLDETIYRITER